LIREGGNRKMSVETSDRSKEKGWIRERILSVAPTLVVILVLAIVSCYIGDFVPVATATTSNPANANGPAPAPAVSASPPMLTELPPQVAVAPLRDARDRLSSWPTFLAR
jgi:hypothetical protein